MHHQDFGKINNLQTWLSKNDWPDLIAQIKGQYLDLEKVQNLHNGAETDVLVDVITKLNTWK